MTDKLKRYLSAKSELESSLISARSLRDQWVAVTNENPTNLTKKEVDNLSKTFRNHLLSVKWDLEDLEELLESGKSGGGIFDNKEEYEEAKLFIRECQRELAILLSQLEYNEANIKSLNKHGIQVAPIGATITTTTSSDSYQNFNNNNNSNNNTCSSGSSSNNNNTIILSSESSYYNQNSKNNGDPMENSSNAIMSGDHEEPEDILIDKRQIESPKRATVFTNALHDYYDNAENNINKYNSNNIDSPTQVFNNLSRPVTNVYMNPNENEMILNMLETEYYNPPSDMTTGSKYLHSIRKFIDYDQKTFLKAIALLFSFPMLLIILFIL